MSLNRRLVAALAALVVIAGIVPAATADDLDHQLDDVRHEIDALSEQIDSAAANSTSLAGDVRAATARMDEVVATLGALDDELGLVRAQLAVKEGALREAQKRAHMRSLVRLQSESRLPAEKPLVCLAKTLAQQTVASCG